MSDSGYAFVLSAILSVLLSIVQTASDSKISNAKSYFTVQLGFYSFIMLFGNILSTLLAEGIVESLDPGQGGEKLVLKGPVWVWYSAIGVFGFEAIIQKLNITIFDKGVLSINDWITKAKSSAVVATLEKAADLATYAEQDLANKLYGTLTGTELHTLVMGVLGADLYQKALASIANDPQINEELYLATIASAEAPKKIRGIIKSYKGKVKN